MTVRLTHDVFCDVCGDWVHAFVSGERRVMDARIAAKKKGWRVKKVAEGRGIKLIDVCPECAERPGDDQGEMAN